MNQTPRLSSRFPETPAPPRQSYASPRNNSPPSSSRVRTPLKDVAALKQQSITQQGPLIPLDVIDAPQQRLLVVSIYVAFFAWRLYEFHTLNEEETESLWAFMKWVVIDGVLLFGLPELHIPWLEWSTMTMFTIFLLHALIDGVLMFRIPIPLGAALVALSKLVYDRETTISGGSVKYSNLIHDNNLLLGRQIIKILPEGSAILNPDKNKYCLGGSRSLVELPVLINQTTPVSLSLVHFDLDNNQNDTAVYTASQLKKLLKEAVRTSDTGVDGLMTIKLPVTKPGLYKLGKVMDKTGLEVRRKIIGDTFVASCPQALIKPLTQHRCRGEASDVQLEVIGTPPLKVKYRKLINQVEQAAQLQGIQPDDFASPLLQQGQSALVSSKKVDVMWARAQRVNVPLSEGLGTSGRWAFSLEEVEDAFGNKVSYSQKDHDNQEKHNSKSPHLHQVITVHERPTVVLAGCSPQHPLKVARGQQVALPVQLGSTGKGGVLDSPYQIEYMFTPEHGLTTSGDHGSHPAVEGFRMSTTNQKPQIAEAGLYTLSGVSTEHCVGEVLEPASCLLQNPPEPSVKLETEDIFDKCAQKSIGLRVDFHLTGTPPFQIQCIISKKGEAQGQVRFIEINGLRGQADLTPPEAGQYVYHFTEVSDSVYKAHSLRDQKLRLEQDVKPSAHASFINKQFKKICIDQQVKYGVSVRGEGPFSVEYELVRGSQRTAYKINDIGNEVFEIETEPLSKGGDYTLSLTSITDGMGCKEPLGDEAKINVRHQKPKASFGTIEGSRTVRTLEDKKVALPLKLTGDGPWRVDFKEGSSSEVKRIQVRQPNDKIEVQTQGVFELVGMHDAICPGTIESSASSIKVEWVPRPTLRLQSDAFRGVSGTTFTKHDICQGEEDSAELHLSGSPPFEVKYEEHVNKALKSNILNAALGVTPIRMDSSQPGLVEYRFKQLSDSNYDHSPRHFQPTIIQQKVHARPFAKFTNPGKTYSYCTSLSSQVEVIPITLTGHPPFSIDYEIKHSGKISPRVHSVNDIKSNTYSLVIPPSELQAGTSAVFLRRVTDSRGCTMVLSSTEPRVQISVHAAPSISAADARSDFCVGDRLSFSLSGTAPFTIFYTFDGKARKAVESGTVFRRLAEKAGDFQITGISDSGSGCRADVDVRARIHGLPSARISDGRTEERDIHEGGSADIEFVFGGQAPWEFTWTRSSLVARGRRAEVLEMRSETSAEDSFRLRAGDEGAYEVVRVRDRWCEVRREGVELGTTEAGQKRLTN